MTIKTILACVSSAESGRSTLETAKHLARRFDGHIEALHVRADPRGLVPYTGEGMDGSMIEEIMEVTEREGGDRAAKTRQMFDDFCSGSGLAIAETPGAAPGSTIAWREETGREDEIVALRGRLFDIVVVGRPMRDAALPSPITLEAALLDTGRPIVIAPPAAPGEIGRSIAIAWESSPEAARAFTASLPLLSQADTVTLLSPEPVEPPGIPAEEALARLAWSGISGSIRKFNISNLEIGAAFLDQAQQAGADILIKGAYAHSRLRQMILGGRTRHIITNTEIPVLLAH